MSFLSNSIYALLMSESRFIIRHYQENDRNRLTELIQVLQDYVADLDPLHLNKSGSSFDAVQYVDHMLGTVSDGKGVIFVAEETSVIGFIAGIIRRTSDDEALEIQRTIDGCIIELVVDPEHRGQQVGKALMEKMEQYFSEQGCEYVRVECFAPNTGAHTFYKKCGYSDRSIEMIKKL